MGQCWRGKAHIEWRLDEAVRSQEEKRKDRTQHAGVRDKRGRQEIVSVVHCKVRINHNFFLPFLNYCRHCKTHIKIHIITLSTTIFYFKLLNCIQHLCTFLPAFFYRYIHNLYVRSLTLSSILREHQEVRICWLSMILIN